MTDEPEYYELKPVYPAPKDGGTIFATAAVLSCSLCGSMIDGMGGPGHGAVCLKCAPEMVHGRLRSCVVWEDAS